MSTAFQRLARRYGQIVQVFNQGNPDGVNVYAFLQPVLEKREAVVPSPLGMARQDRFLYLGDPKETLEEGYVAWRGRTFDVMNAQSIYVGSELSHWWAVLTARDEVADEAG